MSLLNCNIWNSWTWRLLVLAYTLSNACPCVFVTSCSFVEFHMWESLGSSWATGKHSWVLPVLWSLFQKNIYFLLLWFFYQGRNKRMMFRLPLPPFWSCETESTYNKLPSFYYLTISLVPTIHFVHGSGWCPAESSVPVGVLRVGLLVGHYPVDAVSFKDVPMWDTASDSPNVFDPF